MMLLSMLPGKAMETSQHCSKSIYTLVNNKKSVRVSLKNQLFDTVNALWL